LIEDRLDGGRAVDDLVGGNPGQRGSEHDSRHVAAGLRSAEADALQGFPDIRHVLDPDPVKLDVLSVGQVGRIPRVPRGDLTHGSQRRGGQQSAVDPDPQHEEGIFQLMGFQHRSTAAVDPGSTLGVQAPPAKTSAQIAGINPVEAGVAIDVLDAGSAVQAVVVLLHPLVGIQRFPMSHRPLTLTSCRVRPLASRAWGTRRTRRSRHDRVAGLISDSAGFGSFGPR